MNVALVGSAVTVVRTLQDDVAGLFPSARQEQVVEVVPVDVSADLSRELHERQDCSLLGLVYESIVKQSVRSFGVLYFTVLLLDKNISNNSKSP